MTRDQIALEAMKVIIGMLDEEDNVESVYTDTARHAFKFADAFLSVRESSADYSEQKC